jgi:hypothetical protein
MPEHAPPELAPAKARQGTRPRDTVAVLTISLLLAVIAGTALLAYFPS